MSFEGGIGSLASASMTNSAGLENFRQTSTSLTSRRIYIPESIAGRAVGPATIRQICQRDFLDAKIRSNLTVRQSLNSLMINTLKTLAFSHPKSKCATDNHCLAWARKTTFPASVKANMYPRCVEDAKEKFRSCQFKALEKSYCAVYDKGRMVSPERFGGYMPCDNGLRCTVTSPVIYTFGTSWIFRAATGVCKPANPASYRRPVLR